MSTYADRVHETTTTTGTGTVTLGGAVTGCQAFSTAYPGGAVGINYCITDGTNWEVGVGTFSVGADTLSRGRVIASSNSGALVSFGAGSKDVFVTIPGANVADLALTCAVQSTMVPQ